MNKPFLENRLGKGFQRLVLLPQQLDLVIKG
jgi:hypothetical protein